MTALGGQTVRLCLKKRSVSRALGSSIGVHDDLRHDIPRSARPFHPRRFHLGAHARWLRRL